MKFFTYKLWSDFGSPDKACREAAELQWEKNCKAYLSYLRKIEPFVQKDTMRAIYDISNGDVDMHDLRLIGFEFCSTELEKSLNNEQSPLYYERSGSLKLSDGTSSVELVMLNIKKVNFDITYGEETNAFDVRWGYCEFSYSSPYVTMAVLFDNGHVCQFSFSSLIIKKTGDGSVS